MGGGEGVLVTSRTYYTCMCSVCVCKNCNPLRAVYWYEEIVRLGEYPVVIVLFVAGVVEGIAVLVWGESVDEVVV